MKNHKKKYLLRKLRKTERQDWKSKQRYFHSRNNKDLSLLEELPYRESMSNSYGAMSAKLVKRWVNKQVGRHWDNIYSDFLERLQPKHKEQYRECIFWYIEDKTAMIDGKLHYMNKYNSESPLWKEVGEWSTPLYIHPETKILCRLPDEVFSGRRSRRKIWIDFYYKVTKRTHLTWSDKCDSCKKLFRWPQRVKLHFITPQNKMPNGGYVPENALMLCDECYKKSISKNRKPKRSKHTREALYLAIRSSLAKAIKASEELKIDMRGYHDDC